MIIWNSSQDEWRSVKGYEGYYDVSEQGFIRNVKKSNDTISEVLRPVMGNHGYMVVNLSKKGKSRTFRVHRVVAEAFIPNPNNLPQINHRDEDKSNNMVSNLEWCDAVYNVNYGTARERALLTFKKTIAKRRLNNK